MLRSWRFGWLAQAIVVVLASFACAAGAQAQEKVKVASGVLEGSTSADGAIRAFKGVPFAAPPVGDLRWKAPQPVRPWKGVRSATEFGPRAMQKPIYSDMVFRDKGPSEDCLYLNVWTPAKSAKQKLPVMVWIHGGGFQAGAGSEPRQDGENLARKGVVVVNVNYRMGVFGFLAHPELTKESGHGSSGNYAFLDQVAALEWVQHNIAAFGGDPKNVTIFGESAGSFSVCALVASPLAKGLFSKAIGESGAFFGATLSTASLSASEGAGVKFAESLGSKSLADLRSKSAEEILDASSGKPDVHFGPNIDGYFLPQDVASIYAKGGESHVPLLAGWNADEVRPYVTLGTARPTVKSFTDQVHAQYGPAADAILKMYPASTDEEAVRSAGDLACDMFISFGTWKWLEAHLATAGAPEYRYRFDQPVPVPVGFKVNGMDVTGKDVGARHAGEIEYVFGALKTTDVPWQPEDWKLSDQMMSYWSNFAKTGDPNGPGLPNWPRYDASGRQVMILDGAGPKAQAETHRARYEFLDQMSKMAASR